jgi:hypothetical protein
MRMRNLDINGDWTFGKGLSNYVFDQQAIILDVETALREWVNDCFFNMTAGIDWKNLQPVYLSSQLESNLRNLILNRDGVTGIVNLNFTIQNRNFNVEYEIETIFSQSYISSLQIFNNS